VNLIKKPTFLAAHLRFQQQPGPSPVKEKTAGCQPAGFYHQARILSADLERSNPPAVAGMHAATDNIATAVIVVVVIVCVGIVSVIVAVGSEAEPYKRTSVKSASVKSSIAEATACETSMKAATVEATPAAHAASVSTAAATSVTAATTAAATSECRSWLNQADRCQREQDYNRLHYAFPPLDEVAPKAYNTFVA
jgi:hypothetical protein